MKGYSNSKLNKIPIFILFLLISACETKQTSTTSYNVTGHVQKGPFSQGTNIIIQELDNALIPTGLLYSTSTTDYTGTFAVASNLKSSMVEVVATGYYFNEVSGELSASPLTLRVYEDLSVSPHINVNILTSLAHDRIAVSVVFL
ncbi:MAG: hypothetical protein ABIQ95_15680 [Bdellovibrionia bacterium]